MTWDHFYCQPERAHIREEIRIIGKCFALFLFLLFLSLSFHLSQPHFQLWKRLERLKSPFWAQKRIAYFSWNKRRKAFNRIKTFSTMVKGENLLLNFHSFTEKWRYFSMISDSLFFSKVRGSFPTQNMMEWEQKRHWGIQSPVARVIQRWRAAF